MSTSTRIDAESALTPLLAAPVARLESAGAATGAGVGAACGAGADCAVCAAVAVSAPPLFRSTLHAPSASTAPPIIHHVVRIRSLRSRSGRAGARGVRRTIRGAWYVVRGGRSRTSYHAPRTTYLGSRLVDRRQRV